MQLNIPPQFPRLAYFVQQLPPAAQAPLLIILGFVRMVNMVVLIPVLMISAAFIMGITDSGFAASMMNFLTETLNMLHTYAYRCAKQLPDVVGYVECFR